MPGSSTIARGNLFVDAALSAVLTPAASVTAGASTTSTYSIQGLAVGDLIGFNPQGVITAPLAVGAVWVSAPNTLSVQWTNASAATSSASPAAVTVYINLSRPENFPLPTALE